MRACILASIFPVRPFSQSSARPLFLKLLITNLCKLIADCCQLLAYVLSVAVGFPWQLSSSSVALRTPRALAPFHGLVQRIATSNIDQGTAAVECRQGTNFRSLSLRM